MQLITYTDRLGGDLSGLRSVLQNELQGLFSGVHLLPFFDPIDGADAGFDPKDHTRIDPRLGDWRDIAKIAEDYSIMADLIVNHVSADSPQFADVKQNGRESEFWDLFLRRRDVFPEHEPADQIATEVQRIYRPRPGAPFTCVQLDDGSRHEFWTTFSANQLDINVECPGGRKYLAAILSQFANAGISELRLDAAGYAIKRRGTPCFMLPETFEFIAGLSEQAAALGMSTLVEIHSYYQTQIAIANRVGRVYDFALPPLVLHSFYSADTSALKRWLDISPRNCVTVLDTHDGIGIMDVARQGELEGLLADDDIDRLVETIHDKTGGASRQASGHAASNLDIYQVNSTFYSALGGNDADYLIARAIQFFAPGTPQVYYAGLLACENDIDLVKKTGVGRDINRPYCNKESIATALKRPVVVKQIELIRLRNSLQAFAGAFSMPECPDNELKLRWETSDSFAELHTDMHSGQALISYSEAGEVGQYRISR